MRFILAVLLTIVAVAGSQPAKADPYKWCAEYGGSGEGGTNCYFLTLQQCQAAVSGVGGGCRPNNFYDGRPVETSDERTAPRRGRRGL